MKALIRFIYKLIRKKSQYPMTLSFYKESDSRWYIDLPSYPGPKAALEMICGADDMLEVFSKGNNKVIIQIVETAQEATIDYNGYNFRLDKDHTHIEGYGCWYLFQYSKPVWLCDVTLYVLGEFPETIYFKVLNKWDLE